MGSPIRYHNKRPQSETSKGPGDPKGTPIDWVTPIRDPIRNSKYGPQKLTTKGPHFGDSNWGPKTPKGPSRETPKGMDGCIYRWMDGY